jgi:pantetheine-phosphate adenylyltransferase
MMNKKIALFPGSFDPFTMGHFDIVKRGLELFDTVIIGIGTNTTKKRYFEIAQIIKEINGAFGEEERIKVIQYDDLTARINTISQVNRRLSDDLETVFLITSPSFAPISSTVVRELHKFGADISTYIPYPIV